jgi:hypothetical protein
VTAAAPPAGGYAPGPGSHGHHVPFGDRWAALSPRQRIFAFVGVLVAVVIVVNVIAAIRQPPPPSPSCASEPCTPPTRPAGGNGSGVVVHPQPGSTAPRLGLDGTWTFPLGVSIEYDKDVWLEPGTDSQGPDWVTLVSRSKALDGSPAYSLFIQVLPAAGSDPVAIRDARIGYFRPNFPDLLDEPDAKRQVLGIPLFGVQNAVARLLVGTFKGTTSTRTIAVLAASDASVNVVMSLSANDFYRGSAMAQTDSVMASVMWP